MNIAIGSFTACNLSSVVEGHLASAGHTLQRFGALAGDTIDYIDTALGVAKTVSTGDAQQGILFCTTGTGVSIIANKIAGARAALCVDAYCASIARLANNANILCISIRLTGEILAKEIVDTWLETEPSTEPHRAAFHRKTDDIDRLYLRPIAEAAGNRIDSSKRKDD